MKYLKSGGLLLASWAALFLAGPARAGDKEGKGAAEDLNEAIVTANSKLFRVGRVFGETLAPALKEKKVDIPELKKDLKRILKVLEIVQADLKDIKVPSAKVAREYYKTHQAFLKTQEGIAKKDFAEVITVLEDDDLTAAQKKKRIETIIKRVDREEGKLYTELQKAQKAFCKEYGIKLP
jgi:hypothetical protein